MKLFCEIGTVQQTLRSTPKDVLRTRGAYVTASSVEYIYAAREKVCSCARSCCRLTSHATYTYAAQTEEVCNG
jgi:hypothetical protein